MSLAPGAESELSEFSDVDEIWVLGVWGKCSDLLLVILQAAAHCFPLSVPHSSEFSVSRSPASEKSFHVHNNSIARPRKWGS